VLVSGFDPLLAQLIGDMAQTSCPKCFEIMSDDATECSACGATKASLSAEAASARKYQLPSSKPSIFRWKRESILILKALVIGFPLYLAFRWLLWTVLGGSWDSGWTLPF
jgi:hypothetical protein